MATAPYFGSNVPLAWTANADGGLSNFFTEQNGGGILPTTLVTGDCGNGPGETCGGPSSYTLTWTPGAGQPSAPTNGICLGIKFNQASAGTGTTLAVNGGPAFPLADWLGTPINTSGSYIGTVFAGQILPACFTTATSQGGVTAQWYLLPQLGYVGKSGNGWLAESIDNWTQDKAAASANNIGLVAYESGSTYIPGNDTVSQNLYFAAMRDVRMGAAYVTYYNALSAQSPGVLNVFSDIGNFSQYGMWGNLESITSPASTRYLADLHFANWMLNPDLDQTSDSHDFNGDGYSDVLWRDIFGNTAITEMAGPNIIQSVGLGIVPTNWSVVGSRDFDGDGYGDILWRASDGTTVIWFMHNGQFLQSAGLGVVPMAWSVAGTGDFNGDGKGDILWRDTSGDTAIWLMNGRSVAAGVGLGTIPLGWSIAGVGDFNGDGTSDILWHDAGGDTTVWLLKNSSIASAASLGNLPTNWSIVGTGDFNGDGTSDILWRDTAGDVMIWLMRNGTLSQQSVLGNVPTTWTIAETGDFNGDGKSDILWIDTSGNLAIWFMNGFVVNAVTFGNISSAWTIQGAKAD